jgi:hypothetical protein
MDLLVKNRKTKLQIEHKNVKDLGPPPCLKKFHMDYFRNVQQQQNISVYSKSHPKTQEPHYYDAQTDGPCFHLMRYAGVGM